MGCCESCGGGDDNNDGRRRGSAAGDGSSSANGDINTKVSAFPPDTPGARPRFESPIYDSNSPHWHSGAQPRTWLWEKHGEATTTTTTAGTSAPSSGGAGENNNNSGGGRNHPIFVDANLDGKSQFPTGAQSLALHTPGGIVDGEYYSIRVSPALGYALAAAVRIAAQAEMMTEEDVGALLSVAPVPVDRRQRLADEEDEEGSMQLPWPWCKPVIDDDSPHPQQLQLQQQQPPSSSSTSSLHTAATTSAPSTLFQNVNKKSQLRIKHAYHAYTGDNPSMEIGWSSFELCITADCDYALRERNSAPAPCRGGGSSSTGSSNNQQKVPVPPPVSGRSNSVVGPNPASFHGAILPAGNSASKVLPARRCIGGVGIGPRLASAMDPSSGTAAKGSAHSLSVTKTAPSILKTGAGPPLEQAWKFRVLEVFQHQQQKQQQQQQSPLSNNNNINNNNSNNSSSVPRSEETIVVARVVILVSQGRFCLSTDNVERNLELNPVSTEDTAFFGQHVESTLLSMPTPGSAAGAGSFSGSVKKATTSSSSTVTASRTAAAKLASAFEGKVGDNNGNNEDDADDEDDDEERKQRRRFKERQQSQRDSRSSYECDAEDDEYSVEGKPVGLESAHMVDHPAAQWLLHVSSMSHPHSHLHDSDAVTLLESVSHPGFFLTVDSAPSNLRKYALPSMPSPPQWSFSLALRQRHATPFGSGVDGDSLRNRVAQIEHSALEEYCQMTADHTRTSSSHNSSGDLLGHGMSPMRILSGTAALTPAAKRPTRLLPVPLPPCPVAVRDVTQSFRLVHLQRPTLPTGREEVWPWQLPWSGANPVSISIPTSTFQAETCHIQLAAVKPSLSSSSPIAESHQLQQHHHREQHHVCKKGAELQGTTYNLAASAFYIIPDVMWYVRIVSAEDASLCLAATGNPAAAAAAAAAVVAHSPTSSLPHLSSPKKMQQQQPNNNNNNIKNKNSSNTSNSSDNDSSSADELLEVAACTSSSLSRAFAGLPHAETDAQLWRVLFDDAACPVRNDTQQAIRGRMLERYGSPSESRTDAAVEVSDDVEDKTTTEALHAQEQQHAQRIRLRRRGSRLIDFSASVTLANKLFPGHCLSLTNNDNNNNSKVCFVLAPLSDPSYRRHVFIEPFSARRNSAALSNFSVPTRMLSSGPRELFLQRWIRAALDASAALEGFSSDALAINLPQQQQQQCSLNNNNNNNSAANSNNSNPITAAAAAAGISLPLDALSLGIVPLCRIGHPTVVRVVVFHSDGVNSNLTADVNVHTRSFTPSTHHPIAGVSHMHSTSGNNNNINPGNSSLAPSPHLTDSLAGGSAAAVAAASVASATAAAAPSPHLSQQQQPHPFPYQQYPHQLVPNMSPGGLSLPPGAASGSRPTTGGAASSVFSRPQSSLSIHSAEGAMSMAASVGGGGERRGGTAASPTGGGAAGGGVAGALYGGGWILRWAPLEAASYDVDGQMASTPLGAPISSGAVAGAAEKGNANGNNSNNNKNKNDPTRPSAAAADSGENSPLWNQQQQQTQQVPKQPRLDINNTFLFVPVGSFLNDASNDSPVKTLSFLLLHLGSCGVQPVRRPLFLTWMTEINALTLTPWSGKNEQIFSIDMNMCG